MWVVLQAGVCLAVLLFVCVFVGKKIGERKISRVHDEMKALEKSFNHLLEQMELVSSHNLKVLEAKIEELREMLHAADKKCLYANDLLQEVENSRRDVQARLASLPALSANNPDKKLRLEIQGQLEDLVSRFRLLERRVEQIEHEECRPIPPLPNYPARAAAPSLASTAFSSRLPASPFTHQPEHSEKVVAFKSRGETMNRSPRAPAEEVLTLPVPHLEEAPDFEEEALAAMVLEAAAQAARTSNSARRPAQTTNPTAAPNPALNPSGARHPLPEPGTPFHDVVKLAQEGVAIPQIARILKMGKGEVELIMNIYGNRLNMRKVM